MMAGQRAGRWWAEPEWLDAFRAMGIDVERCMRVMIDFKIGSEPQVHVVYRGDRTTLGLIQRAADESVIILREPPDHTIKRTEPDQTTYATGRASVDPPPVDVRPDPWLRA